MKPIFNLNKGIETLNSILASVLPITTALGQAGGTAFMVGGVVRDSLLGLPCKDVDFEVFGIEIDQMLEVLNQFGTAELVGKSFGVIKLNWQGQEFDFAVPRVEIKTGDKHTDFEVIACPNLSTVEAAMRRDLTINAIMFNCIDGSLVDHFGGLSDLEKGILRHTSEKFAEDALRVMRVVQFAARFDFEVHPSTIAICQNLLPKAAHLSNERIWEELVKLIQKGLDIKMGLVALAQTHWDKHLSFIDTTAMPTPTGVFWFDFLEISHIQKGQAQKLSKVWRFPAKVADCIEDWFKVQDKATDIEKAEALLDCKHMTLDDACKVGFLDIVQKFDLKNFAPALTGDMLIAGGMKPSKAFGQMLFDARRSQLEALIQE